MKSDVHQDDGDEIRLLKRTGHITHNTLSRKRSNELIFRIKRGESPIGEETEFMLRYKDDNENEFSEELKGSLETLGNTEMFVRFHRLGMYRSRQWELTATDNTPIIISEVFENVEVESI